MNFYYFDSSPPRSGYVPAYQQHRNEKCVRFGMYFFVTVATFLSCFIIYTELHSINHYNTFYRNTTITDDFYSWYFDKTESTNEEKKVLVIVNGLIRGGPMAAVSLLNRVVKVNNADLALIGDFSSENAHVPPHADILVNVSKYIWNVQDVDDFGLYFSLYSGNDSWKKTYYCSSTDYFGGIKECQSSGSGAIQLMYLEETRKQIAMLNKLNKQYDWYIYTRSDYLYECDMENVATFDKSKVYIKNGWPYVSDRQLIVHNDNYLNVFGLVQELFSNIEVFNSTCPLNGGIETMLTCYIQYINNYPTARFTVPGGNVKYLGDTTRWNKGQFSEELKEYNLKRKYWQNDLKATTEWCKKDDSKRYLEFESINDKATVLGYNSKIASP